MKKVYRVLSSTSYLLSDEYSTKEDAIERAKYLAASYQDRSYMVLETVCVVKAVQPKVEIKVTECV